MEVTQDLSFWPMIENASVLVQLVLAVLFGCNLCYATPVAYQTNMMILSEGDYTFRDYLRSGIPLVAIMTVALSVLLVLWYGI